jgi:hypothetical protein
VRVCHTLCALDVVTQKDVIPAVLKVAVQCLGSACTQDGSAFSFHVGCFMILWIGLNGRMIGELETMFKEATMA